MPGRNLSSRQEKARQQELLDLPFDQYQRYRDVKEIVERLRPGSKPLRLLDVGGAEAQYLPALDFFPHDHVWVADLHILRSPRYIPASGIHLPFVDQAFDVVFSCDTLEHVPRKDREQFVREMFRVAHRFVILVAPFRTTWNKLAEKISQKIYTEETGEPHKALREHAECGLPERRKIEPLIKRLSADCLTFASGNIHNWLLMNSIIFTLGPISGELHRAANRLYNLNFYERDHAPPAYRTGFVGCKMKRDSNLLKRLRKEFPTWFAVQPHPLTPSPQLVRALRTQPAFSSWRESISSFKKALKDNRKKEALRVELETRASDLEQQIAHRDNLLQGLRQEVAHRDNLLGEAEQQVAHLGNQLEEARQGVAHRDNLLGERAQQVAHVTNLLEIARQEAEHQRNLLAQASDQLRAGEKEIAAHLGAIENLQTQVAELQMALQQAGYEREYLELELDRAQRELNSLPVRLLRALRRWLKPQEEERTA